MGNWPGVGLGQTCLGFVLGYLLYVLLLFRNLMVVIYFLHIFQSNLRNKLLYFPRERHEIPFQRDDFVSILIHKIHNFVSFVYLL